MEAKAKPDIFAEADADEAAFLESIGADMPEGEELSAVDARIDYLLEKIGDRQHQIEHVSDVASRRIAMVQEWLDGEKAKLEREIEWLGSQVRAQVPPTPDALQEVYGTKKKSISLPHGSVGFRASRDTVAIEDKDAALEYAKANVPDAVRVSERVVKTPLIEHAKVTGVAKGDGWRFVPGEDSFFVKAG